MTIEIDETKVNALITAADSRYVQKVVGKDLSTNDYTDAEKTKLAGLQNVVVDSALDENSTNPVQNSKVKEALDTKVDSEDLATVATTGEYSDLLNKPTLASLGGTVTVEKQQSAETGYVSTYVVKQNGAQVGSKINIPKDFLVKSVSIEEVETADSPVTGYQVGDTYIDFVVNTVDSDETAEHLYLLVTDLIDVYTADEDTLTLSNNEFSIKAGGVTSTELATAVNTSLGYADEWHSSVAHGITSSDVTNWDNKSELEESDITDVVEAYITGITNALES